MAKANMKTDMAKMKMMEESDMEGMSDEKEMPDKKMKKSKKHKLAHP